MTSDPKARPKVTLTVARTPGTLQAPTPLGYDPTRFAHIKGSIASVDSACHHAVWLYAARRNAGGALPTGAKTSYAKQILLHHPERSLKTTRNLVSVAFALQTEYGWLLDIWYQGSVAPHQISLPAAKALKDRVRQDLVEGEFTQNLSAIEQLLRGKYE